MQSECSSQSCGSGACASGQTCGNGGCGQGQGCGSGDKMRWLAGMAKMAKMELLSEKIKAKLEAKIGSKLDAEADIAVEMLLAKYEMKGSMMKKKQELASKLEDVMRK